jgi:hypothetical protein
MTLPTAVMTSATMASSGLQRVPLSALGRISTGWPEIECCHLVSHGRRYPVIGGGGRCHCVVSVPAYGGLRELRSRKASQKLCHVDWPSQ